MEFFFEIARSMSINPFSTNVPLLYPLKTSENLRFSDVFRGYRSGTLVKNGLRLLHDDHAHSFQDILETTNEKTIHIKIWNVWQRKSTNFWMVYLHP